MSKSPKTALCFPMLVSDYLAPEVNLFIIFRTQPSLRGKGYKNERCDTGRFISVSGSPVSIESVQEGWQQLA